jgi:hypothetical protein
MFPQSRRVSVIEPLGAFRSFWRIVYVSHPRVPGWLYPFARHRPVSVAINAVRAYAGRTRDVTT